MRRTLVPLRNLLPQRTSRIARGLQSNLALTCTSNVRRRNDRLGLIASEHNIPIKIKSRQFRISHMVAEDADRDVLTSSPESSNQKWTTGILLLIIFNLMNLPIVPGHRYGSTVIVSGGTNRKDSPTAFDDGVREIATASRSHHTCDKND